MDRSLRRATDSPAPGPTGRFAPTPSGPLHFGSVVAAAGSFLSARSAGGRWLLRIDDLDTPRNAPGAAAAILAELERLGLEWDGPHLAQSTRLDAYRAALARLESTGLTYPCACTRREVGPGPYPGTCGTGLAPGRTARSVRLRCPDGPIRFADRIRGEVSRDLRAQTGDFVVLRADAIVGYHLATVIDDDHQGVDEIVRGGDLLDVTPQQVHLQRCLGLWTPAYAHLPTAIGPGGHKLSKQTHAEPVAAHPAARVVGEALAFLGHAPPPSLRGAPPAQQWAWALSSWDPRRIPRAPEQPSPL